jgi:hypothetical protein
MGMLYFEQKMDIMYHFYTKDKDDNSVIVPILASDEDHAWDIFEAMGYSESYSVDQVIRVG